MLRMYRRAVLTACLCCLVACTPVEPPAGSTPTPVSRPVATPASTPTTPPPVFATQTPLARPPVRLTRTMQPAAPVPTSTPLPTESLPLPVLDGILNGVVPDELASEYALVLEDLASGVRTSLNADSPLPSASLYKLGVAWVVMRQVDAGLLNLDSMIEIEDDDAVEPEPYGGFGVGDTPSIQDLMSAMLSLSSNAAAHALLRTIGRDAFTNEMERLGLHQTRIPDDGLATTSADDMSRLLRLIATSSELSSGSRSAIARSMSSIAPPDALRDALPEGVDIFDKTGNLDDASNVGALLETPRATAILVVIDTGVDPGDARAIIAQAGQIAYRALLQEQTDD